LHEVDGGYVGTSDEVDGAVGGGEGVGLRVDQAVGLVGAVVG
jgi:hypothetical protein